MLAVGLRGKGIYGKGVRMRIEVQHPAFKRKHLSVETPTVFSGPKLLLNGVAVKKEKG
jgi:hypothetical protein